MGWTFERKEPGVTLKEWFKHFAEVECRMEVLDVEVLGSVIYAAVRDAGSEQVVGSVILTEAASNPRYNFGYKLMDESMGPMYYECPERIIKLLTPTDSEWANKWRWHCLKNSGMSSANIVVEYNKYPPQ